MSGKPILPPQFFAIELPNELAHYTIGSTTSQIRANVGEGRLAQSYVHRAGNQAMHFLLINIVSGGFFACCTARLLVIVPIL